MVVDNLITEWILKANRTTHRTERLFLMTILVSILQKGSGWRNIWPIRDLVNLRPDSDGQDYAIIEESHLESLGQLNHLLDPKVARTVWQTCWATFAQSSTYDRELRSDARYISRLSDYADNGCLIVESEEGYIFWVSSKNYVLCLLIGDNNAAKFMKWCCDLRITPTVGSISVKNWVFASGVTESEFEYTFFFDQRLSWWNSLFGEFQTLEPDSDHRELSVSKTWMLQSQLANG